MARDDLIQRIDQLKAARWSGTAYRHTAPQYPALSGTGAAAVGGRWNPRGIATIYLAQPEAACVAEFMRMAEGQARGAGSFLPRDLHTIEVSDLQVLDVTAARTRRALAIELADIERPNRARCQEVGEAAAYLGLQGIVAPSATRVGIVIAVFERNVRQGQLALTGTKQLELALDGPPQ